MTVVRSDVELAEVFVMISDSLREGYDIVDTLDLLVQASTAFTEAVEAGILLADSGGRLHVAASSSERTSDVEEAQLGAGHGPCLDAVRWGHPVEVPDLDAAYGVWPEFVSVARGRGFRAAHAVPMEIRTHTLGGLNLFCVRVGALSDRDAALASALAQIATISIVQHQRVSSHGLVTAQLQRALESRVVIEQAKGVIAQQRGIPIDSAFAVLRGHSRSSSTGLHEIASQVVDRRLVISQ